jgi:hypothetical protein
VSPRGAAFLICLVACGVGEPRARSRGPTPDKAALFGDPTLVPTRVGEQARRELARAGEIEAAIAVLPGVDAVRVTVESAEPEHRVVVTLRASADEASVRRAVAAIVEGVMGRERPHALALIVDATSPDIDRPTGIPLALALALVGLGASAGITLDRLARLRRRRRRRIA